MSKQIEREGKIINILEYQGNTHVVIEVQGKFEPKSDNVYILIDPEKKTSKQLGFFHAICKDIEEFTGDHRDNIKESFKSGIGVETLADASKVTMNEIIEVALSFCRRFEVPLRDKTIEFMDATQRVSAAFYYKSCLLCGKPVDIHHVDKVGMGRNRESFDKMYPSAKKLPFCREHHTELETSGNSAFIAKHHLQDYEPFFERSRSVV